MVNKDTDTESKGNRLIDIVVNGVKKCNFVVAIIIFIAIIICLTDFFARYVLTPLKLGTLDGMSNAVPDQEGYLVIAGSIAMLYIIIDVIYQMAKKDD